VRMGESVMPGNRLGGPGPGEEMGWWWFVTRAAICALKDGASSSGGIVGVPSVAIIANFCGRHGPSWIDSWAPGGYEKESRDADAGEPGWLY
jgi:hypothetical protein